MRSEAEALDEGALLLGEVTSRVSPEALKLMDTIASLIEIVGISPVAALATMSCHADAATLTLMMMLGTPEKDRQVVAALMPEKEELVATAWALRRSADRLDILVEAMK